MPLKGVISRDGCEKHVTGYYRLQGSRVRYTEIPGYILTSGAPSFAPLPPFPQCGPPSLSPTTRHTHSRPQPKHQTSTQQNQHAQTMSSSSWGSLGPALSVDNFFFLFFFFFFASHLLSSPFSSLPPSRNSLKILKLYHNLALSRGISNKRYTDSISSEANTQYSKSRELLQTNNKGMTPRGWDVFVPG